MTNPSALCFFLALVVAIWTGGHLATIPMRKRNR